MAAGPKAEIREVFHQQISKLKEYAEEDEKQLTNEEPGKFFVPEKRGWDGDLFDLEGMSEAFNREEIHEDFRKTITDKGLTTDLEIVTLQGDFIASLERAYRARHHTPIRARCHAAGRRMGHHDDDGVFTKGLLGYLEHLKRLAGS